MEKNDGISKSLRNKVLLGTGALLIGTMAINHGVKINEIKNLTSTYQGYTVDDGKEYLVFDDKTKEAREGLPELMIEGKHDTLVIGKKYTLKYAVRNWRNIFPDQIKEIKYAK